jgi:hypothetical protein
MGLLHMSQNLKEMLHVQVRQTEKLSWILLLMGGDYRIRFR